MAVFVFKKKSEMENTFEQFALNRQLFNAIADSGYEKPTEIQQKTIPLILQGHDILGIAQTGTGKTAAYLLPILMKVKYAQGTNPRCIILAPTRELVIQIDSVITQLAKYTDIRHLAIYGGLGPKPQMEAIEAGIDILVATPARLMEMYLKGILVLKQVKVMVLDEADKIMDMGFMPQIRKILEVLPRKRQNLLFSATFSEKVENLSAEFLEFPTKIEITPQATAAETVKQVLYEVPNLRTKINLLAHLLQNKEKDMSKVLIFTRSKLVADNVFKFLERKIIHPDLIRVLHANKGQNTRINTMNLFRDGSLKVLVATDVAARGIDIQLVSHVINFDVPIIYEDYVHRIGRTGRALQLGEAITFVTMAEEYHLEKIEKIIRNPIPREEFPADVEITETPFDEQQAMLREIDNQRKKENPDFQGAFHEKKARPSSFKIQATAKKGTSKGSKKNPAKNSSKGGNPKSKRR